MTDRALDRRRTHNLLLFQRLLTLREGSSPFTLILDSLEQSGRPLVDEYIRRAKLTRTSVTYVAFETARPRAGIDTFIKARRKDLAVLQREIAQATTTAVSKGNTKTLIIIETLHPFLPPSPTFLSSLLHPHASLLATYHLDVPVPATSTPPYHPAPLTLLKYLATTIFTTHSLAHILARHRAAAKSLADPVFGLAEELDGVLVGLGSNDARGVVLEMEHRRKSGRGVGEWFFLPARDGLDGGSAPSAAGSTSLTVSAGKGTGVGGEKERAILLDDHPLYRASESQREDDGGGFEGDGDGGATFDLGLTEKQRRDRDGVVLPYMDAQSGEGGRGGRILYDMGVEDDFDEEEDEI